MTAWSNHLRDTDVLWTRSSFPNQTDPGGNGSGFAGLEAAHQAWEWNWPPTGVHVRKKVSGTVLTSTGVPVSGATVRLFNTATGLQVDTQTTGVDGSFTLGDPNAVNCFAVADATVSSTEESGTTIQELTGV